MAVGEDVPHSWLSETTSTLTPYTNPAVTLRVMFVREDVKHCTDV